MVDTSKWSKLALVFTWRYARSFQAGTRKELRVLLALERNLGVPTDDLYFWYLRVFNGYFP